MSFWQSIQTCFQKYFVFSGRATREEFWWFTLFVSVGTIFLSPIDMLVFGVGSNSPPVFDSIFSLATIIPSLSVGWRRLHDIGKNGWWNIPMIVGFIVGIVTIFIGIITALEGAPQSIVDYAFYAGITITIASVVWIVLWLAKEGDGGENQYGPDPRAAA